MAEWQGVADTIRSGKRFILITHERPDGDALGSCIGLSHCLEAMGKTAHVVSTSAVPRQYRFLDPTGKRVTVYDGSAEQQQLFADADVILQLDTNRLARTGLAEPVAASSAKRVVIDHHTEPELTPDVLVDETEASSTGELIFGLLKFLICRPNQLAATALYTAIMTDTGSFRFPRTTPEVHRIAAELLECGANPTEIYRQIYDSNLPSYLQMSGRVLAGIRTAYDGLLAYSTVTAEMFKETGTVPSDIDGMVNSTLSLDGVMMGILFYERPEDPAEIKLSFRSRGDIAANKLAATYGGGGHLNAAGATLRGSLEEVVARVLADAEPYLTAA